MSSGELEPPPPLPVLHDCPAMMIAQLHIEIRRLRQ
jgi:hypothetical protein